MVMAGVCLQSQEVITTMYSSGYSRDLAHSPQGQHPSLWRQDHMLPLQCLMDSKAGGGALRSPSLDGSLQQVPPVSRRRVKKKLLKKRKSVSSVSSCTSLSSSPRHLFGAGNNQDKAFWLPDVNISSSRIDELSMPSLRAAGVIPNLVAQPHECRKKLPLLSAIKPENEKSERERFMRANFNYNPHFLYRSLVDEETMERFNTPSDHYLNIAILIMQETIRRFGTYEEFEEQTGGRILSKAQIMSLVRKYLKMEALESEIQVNLSEDLLSRGSMTHKNGKAQLNVRVVNLREHWCEGLLRHELGTHYLRSMNNRGQVWGGGLHQRRELCLQHYNPTEEGLASLHSVLFRTYPYLWRAALLYYVTYKAANMSFKDLFNDLGRFVHDPLVRWDYCVRAKRGQSDTSFPGSFCKDQVYLDGALQLLKRRRYLDFHLLVRMGKVAHGDMERLVDHCQLEGTRIPSFMEDLSAYRKQLNHIAECNRLTDSILANVE